MWAFHTLYVCFQISDCFLWQLKGFFFFLFFLLGFRVFLFWFKLLRGHSSLKECGTQTILNVLCVDCTEQYSRSSLQLCHCWLHLLGWGLHMMIASAIHLAVQIFVRRPSGGLLDAITTYHFGCQSSRDWAEIYSTAWSCEHSKA
jgi:hypothetical protein